MAVAASYAKQHSNGDHVVNISCLAIGTMEYKSKMLTEHNTAWLKYGYHLHNSKSWGNAPRTAADSSQGQQT